MNADQNLGAGRSILGEGESKLGDAIDSSSLKKDGVADQVTGFVQQGYGSAKDAVTGVIEDAPAVLSGAADRGREWGRQADDYVRRELGDNGPLYVLAGAAALLGAGLLAFTQLRSAPASTPTPAKRRQANSARKPAAAKPRTPRRTQPAAD